MAEETGHAEATSAPDAAAGDPDPSHVPGGEPPPLPPTAAALASKAKDLEALRDAVVDAASVGAGLWFSYLFVLFYLLIAVGGVTHRDLFLENPVRLPFLNVDLPLLGFFWLGPAIFLVVHAYVLLHFVLVAGKVGDFDAELKEQIKDEEVRRRLRRQLPSNIFVQFLAGPREVRSGVLGFLLQAVAWISLVIGPIALLVFFELQFLPYHNEAISWWHRSAVAADIVLLWILWPSIARGERAGLSRADLRRGKIVALLFASLTPVLLVSVIATFPGEWLDDSLWKDATGWRPASLRTFLVAGEVNPAARKPKSIWSNRLVLPGSDAIDHSKFDNEAKTEAASETISLRARHLEGAVLIGAKLRKADFTAAQLQGAQFAKSDLRGAKFECNLDVVPAQQCANLQRASLDNAQLQGALLGSAQLQGAKLLYAHLNGAKLESVNLQGAILGSAQLQGAELYDPQLQGASLDSAQLQGAFISGANLQGASLDSAQLQGADLESANLQCAWLNNAQLQGAELHSANLQGASLDNAQLQGALLISAQLRGASLVNVFVWRTDAQRAVWGDTLVLNPETGPKYECMQGLICDWRPESFNELKKMIAEQIPDGAMRSAAMTRIEQRLDPDPTKGPGGDDDMAKFWKGKDQARSSPATVNYAEHLAAIWQETGCAAEGAPYVLRGLLRNLSSPYSPFSKQRSEQSPRKLAKAFLDAEHCPGAHGLSDDERAQLKEIRDRSPPPASKQQ